VARLVALEAACRSLLADAIEGTPFDVPDALRVSFSPDGGLDVEYMREGISVAGEGV
jgi:hypothetical protein